MLSLSLSLYPSLVRFVLSSFCTLSLSLALLSFVSRSSVYDISYRPLSLALCKLVYTCAVMRGNVQYYSWMSWFLLSLPIYLSFSWSLGPPLSLSLYLSHWQWHPPSLSLQDCVHSPPIIIVTRPLQDQLIMIIHTSHSSSLSNSQ